MAELHPFGVKSGPPENPSSPTLPFAQACFSTLDFRTWSKSRRTLPLAEFFVPRRLCNKRERRTPSAQNRRGNFYDLDLKTFGTFDLMMVFAARRVSEIGGRLLRALQWAESSEAVRRCSKKVLHQTK
jgi:hypothetical protein